MSRILLSAVWHGVPRAVVFWTIVLAVGAASQRYWPAFDINLITAVVTEVWTGELQRVSTPEFAYALAAGMATAAAALAVAFLLMHVVTVRFALRRARRRVKRSADMLEFAHGYEAIYEKFCRHPLIGHAWKEFDETLVKPSGETEPIRNTVRPQAFVNAGLARDKLFGLKLMPSVPGYFVGVGLLLTFAGLVLALHKAAGAVSSSDAAGMQAATRGLLQVATFKFATSISGLGASIALSFFFRTYMIWIEGGFHMFCEAVEKKLRYTAPQSITAEMNMTLAAQLTELKQINSAEFFARMGQEISPQIQAAFTQAITPVTTSIDEAVNKLAQNSQSGVTELIDRFSESVQGSAGAELRELAGSLRQMQEALAATQQGIHGTGEDFGRRLTEAAENLSRLVADAGQRMDETSDKTRAVLLETVSALRETFERANTRVNDELGRAAAGASAQVEAAMGRVLERLEGQIDRFTAAMKESEATLAAQANAVREAASQSRSVADAFSQTAQDVRAASAPLVQSGTRIADASEKMRESIARSVEALEASQNASRQLADELGEHRRHLQESWANYTSRFESVDQELASTIEKISIETGRLGEMLGNYTLGVDEGLTGAISNLKSFLDGLSENTEELNEAVGRLARTFPQAAE